MGKKGLATRLWEFVMPAVSGRLDAYCYLNFIFNLFQCAAGWKT